MPNESVTYHGEVEVNQPVLALDWVPNETKEVDQAVADRLCTPGSLFTRPAATAETVTEPSGVEVSVTPPA